MKVMAARQDRRIWCASLPSPIGEVCVAATTSGVCRVSYGRTQEQFVDGVERDLGPCVPGNTGPLQQAIAELAEYFAGKRRRFTCPVDLSCRTPFQQRVLQTVSRIPWGSVLSYAEVAEQVGAPRAARAIGGVMSRNPVPILVPCHRVIRAGGQLGGFGGGLGYKIKLLALEGIGVAGNPSQEALVRVL
jgi:methylated-DNA-[protein]-cysteine S-methyltransferase